jgi:hypothetical protein
VYGYDISVPVPLLKSKVSLVRSQDEGAGGGGAITGDGYLTLTGCHFRNNVAEVGVK